MSDDVTTAARLANGVQPVTPVSAAEATLSGRFRELVAEWKEASQLMSSIVDMALLPSYQHIIGLGPAAIPLLLEELRREPDHWFWALKAITGADPVPRDYRGNVLEMSRCWIDWGREHGYLN